jgi:hypothetical protein
LIRFGKNECMVGEGRERKGLKKVKEEEEEKRKRDEKEAESG